MKNLLLCCLCLSIMAPAELRAQENNGRELKERPFQFTFLCPPLSTNGAGNSQTVNKLSLNLLVGNSGGVNGFEAGGLVNSVNHDVTGSQISGFGNVVGGSVNGCQLAGFMNINGGSTTKCQGSGFINISGQDMEGLQATGFLNIAGGNTTGAQLAGFGNVTGKADTGFQGAGFFNIAEAVKGSQVSGFINVAGYVEGIQLAGFINICDSIDGIPLAFISIVRNNGYKKAEFSMSEVRYATFSYKMGVRKLYGIYSLGKPQGPGNRWIYGFGFGSEFDLKDKLVLNLEAETGQEIWIADGKSGRLLHTDRLNLHNQIRANFGWEMNERATLFIGPSFNVSVSETSQDIGFRPWNPIAPSWSLFNRTSTSYDKTNVSIWIGINGGIRF